MVSKRYVDAAEDRLHDRIDTHGRNLFNLATELADLSIQYDRLLKYLDLEEVTTPRVTYIRKRVATKQKQETGGGNNG